MEATVGRTKRIAYSPMEENAALRLQATIADDWELDQSPRLCPMKHQNK
jgi:hypothetical protein